MGKQLLFFVCAVALGTNFAICADSQTSRNLIGQNWYCTDNYQGIHRYIFDPNGTFSEAFFTPTPKGLKYWNPGATAIGYTIVSPSQIKILDSSFNPSVLYDTDSFSAAIQVCSGGQLLYMQPYTTSRRHSCECRCGRGGALG